MIGFSEVGLVLPEQWIKLDKTYQAIRNGLKIDTADMWPGMQPICQTIENTLVIHIQGYLTRVIDPVLRSVGATSAEEIIKFIVQGVKQQGINQIVLKMHSPGGDPSAVIVLGKDRMRLNLGRRQKFFLEGRTNYI